MLTDATGWFTALATKWPISSRLATTT